MSNVDELVNAVRAFLEKWPEAEAGINSCIAMSQIHGAPYPGPSLEAELDAMRNALAQLEDK